jgi:hypothetical protein
VEKVEAKNEKNGTFVLRTSKPVARHTFRVDAKTKVLRDTGDPLELGLQSPLLKGARARVTFDDRQPAEAKAGRPAERDCRVLQLTKTAK